MLMGNKRSHLPYDMGKILVQGLNKSLDAVSRVHILTFAYLCGLEHAYFFLIYKIGVITEPTS